MHHLVNCRVSLKQYFLGSFLYLDSMALFKMGPKNHILNFLELDKREWARSFSLELDLRKGDDQLRSENTPLTTKVISLNTQNSI